MSSIVISGDTSGAVTLTVPAVAGTNTVTLSNQTGTIYAAGPAFSAYQGTAQSVTSGTWTKVTFNTEEFDTNNNFASNRFTPTIAGYYQINAGVASAVAAQNYFASAIYKNGSIYKIGSSYSTTVTVTPNSSVASLIYFNGSTDYVEIYVIQATTGNTNPGIEQIYINGCLVRGA